LGKVFVRAFVGRFDWGGANVRVSLHWGIGAFVCVLVITDVGVFVRDFVGVFVCEK
jgi:hypothetical protein